MFSIVLSLLPCALGAGNNLQFANQRGASGMPIAAPIAAPVAAPVIKQAAPVVVGQAAAPIVVQGIAQPVMMANRFARGHSGERIVYIDGDESIKKARNPRLFDGRQNFVIPANAEYNVVQDPNDENVKYRFYPPEYKMRPVVQAPQGQQVMVGAPQPNQHVQQNVKVAAPTYVVAQPQAQVSKPWTELYDYMKELGSGGFGNVALVRRKSDGKEVCLKRFMMSENQQQFITMGHLESLFATPQDREAISGAGNECYYAQVLQESDDPAKEYFMTCYSTNIPSGTDASTKPGPSHELYLEISFAGRDLEDLLPTFELEQVENILGQLAESLIFLRKMRITHHDLKLPNIMYNGSTIKIIDFGAMSSIDNYEHQSSAWTPLYAPYEFEENTVDRITAVDAFDAFSMAGVITHIILNFNAVQNYSVNCGSPFLGFVERMKCNAMAGMHRIYYVKWPEFALAISTDVSFFAAISPYLTPRASHFVNSLHAKRPTFWTAVRLLFAQPPMQRRQGIDLFASAMTNSVHPVTLVPQETVNEYVMNTSRYPAANGANGMQPLMGPHPAPMQYMIEQRPQVMMQQPMMPQQPMMMVPEMQPMMQGMQPMAGPQVQVFGQPMMQPQPMMVMQQSPQAAYQAGYQMMNGAAQIMSNMDMRGQSPPIIVA